MAEKKITYTIKYTIFQPDQVQKKIKYTRKPRTRVRMRMQQKRPRSLVLSSFVITCCACDMVGIASVPVCTVCVGTSWVESGRPSHSCVC